MFIRKIVLATALAVGVFIVPGPVRAEEPEWPSETEDRLEKLEEDIIEVRFKLGVARLNNQADDVEKLGKQFNEMQKEHLKLLRDAGQIDF